jgi:hypothetical protein
MMLALSVTRMEPCGFCWFAGFQALALNGSGLLIV